MPTNAGSAGSLGPRNLAATEPIDGWVPTYGLRLSRWAEALPACMGAGKWSVLDRQSTERMIAWRSVRAARRGKCSQMRTPGTRVAMLWNGPRISTGASDFRSQVSRWLGPPDIQIRITARLLGAAARAWPRSRP